MAVPPPLPPSARTKSRDDWDALEQEFFDGGEAIEAGVRAPTEEPTALRQARRRAALRARAAPVVAFAACLMLLVGGGLWAASGRNEPAAVAKVAPPAEAPVVAVAERPRKTSRRTIAAVAPRTKASASKARRTSAKASEASKRPAKTVRPRR